MKAIAEGRIIAGRYRLERVLAKGGMASVWVARHVQLDKPVAIKFMDSAYAPSPEARARFEREAKASAHLHSPHVVAVHDYGVDDTTPWLVMDLLEGEDLHTRLKRERRLSLTATSKIATQMAKALRRAQDAGIVHRDIKPRNVFLAKHDEDEVLKILDFGVAKTAGLGQVGEATKTGVLLGSPHYMSPEQARRARDVDHRSDLWSLAVILYRAVTGALPFPGDEVGDVIVKICTESPPPVSTFDAHLPPALDAFFARALAREMDARFANATDLAIAFAEAAGVVEAEVAMLEVAAAPPSVKEIAPPPMESPKPAPAAETQPIEEKIEASKPRSVPPPPRGLGALAFGPRSKSEAPKPGSIAPPRFDIPPPPKLGVDAVAIAAEENAPPIEAKAVVSIGDIDDKTDVDALRTKHPIADETTTEGTLEEVSTRPVTRPSSEEIDAGEVEELRQPPPPPARVKPSIDPPPAGTFSDAARAVELPIEEAPSSSQRATNRRRSRMIYGVIGGVALLVGVIAIGAVNSGSAPASGPPSTDNANTNTPAPTVTAPTTIAVATPVPAPEPSAAVTAEPTPSATASAAVAAAATAEPPQARSHAPTTTPTADRKRPVPSGNAGSNGKKPNPVLGF